jgi:Domain of unknown function (DUF4407)
MSQNKSVSLTGKYNRLRRRAYPFFWFLAASDENLLIQSPIPDQDKHAGVGMAILCTAVAAIISSFYAIYSLFQNWCIALPIALFWGIIIFNLDRFMVGSMRKDKQKNILSELKIAIPRLILAFFIAILISKPLEVKIFYNQIEAERITFNDSLRSKSLANRDIEVAQKKRERDSSQNLFVKVEIKSKDYGTDPSYILAKKDFDECIVEQTKLEGRISQFKKRRQQIINSGNGDRTGPINREIQELRNQIKRLDCITKRKEMTNKADEYLRSNLGKVKEAERVSDSLKRDLEDEARQAKNIRDTATIKIGKAGEDILGQLRILDSLKKKDAGMWWASWLITALFFILELAPLIVKIFSPRGKYDTLIAIEELKAFDNEEAAKEESRKEKEVRIDAANNNANEVGEIDEQVRQKVKEKVMAAQAELAEKIIEIWKEQEEAQLKADPTEYLSQRITKLSENN